MPPWCMLINAVLFVECCANSTCVAFWGVEFRARRIMRFEPGILSKLNMHETEVHKGKFACVFLHTVFLLTVPGYLRKLRKLWKHCFGVIFCVLAM